MLWFAEKFVSLLIEQHPSSHIFQALYVVICWKIRIFAYWTTPLLAIETYLSMLWFAEKFVSLLIEQHPQNGEQMTAYRCDLLKNSYLCLLNNTGLRCKCGGARVVICWKIRIFAYWTTPILIHIGNYFSLWFAEKFVSLLIEQHLKSEIRTQASSCDLLKNSYLCLLNNTWHGKNKCEKIVVICWKIRIFAYWTTPINYLDVTFKVLWFAEKFVSLLIEQHRRIS